jgi:endonuclease-8
MPEGPEIRRAADKIAAVLEDQVIEQVYFGLPDLTQYDEQLSGQRVTWLETRGKALLTHFDHGLSIYSHNQLYGRWYVVKRGKEPATRRSLRLALHTQSHSALLYSASDIAVLDSDGMAQHPFLARIGPDILNPTLHWRDVAKILSSPSFVRRGVGAFYLEQSFLAGIGNYLRSEILFEAGVNPRKKPGELSAKQLNDLARATLSISQRAYKTGGITNSEANVKALKKQGLKRRDYRHWVFGCDNQNCHRCGEIIIKESIASRRLYWCPLCQY